VATTFQLLGKPAINMSRDFSQSFSGNSENDSPRQPGFERKPSVPFAKFAPKPANISGRNGAATAPAPVTPLEREKRRYPRFKCEGALELKTDGSTIRTWATFTDVSATGCYVEMMTTFPVGTKMELQLGMNGFLVNGAAIVRATYPFLGMGIEFTDLSLNAREQLESMVASLTNLRIQRPEEDINKGLKLPPITEPTAALEALAEHFSKHQNLSTEEFLRILSTTQPRCS
jgi:hypothetical protein